MKSPHLPASAEKEKFSDAIVSFHFSVYWNVVPKVSSLRV